MNDKNICIKVENISLYRDGNVILDKVSFSIKQGEYFAIIGPNGAGKTTLLEVMLGILKPASGKVTVFGQDIDKFKARSQFGYIPQHISQTSYRFPATVKEIVVSGRTAKIGLFKRSMKSDLLIIENAMKAAGIAEYRDRLLKNLSGGERQRVFIARALAGEPHILVLDEPIFGMDIVKQEKFYDLLEELNHKMGLTIILVTHNIGAVAHQVQCILCLNRAVVCQGAPVDMLKDEYIEKLYGKNVKFIEHKH